MTPFLAKNGEAIFGIQNLDPQNREHVEFVGRLEVPEMVVEDCSERYSRLEKMLLEA